LKSALLKWTKTEKLVKSGSRRARNFESQSHLALALKPRENQIFMPCLDAHLYRVSQKWRTNGALRCRRDYRKRQKNVKKILLDLFADLAVFESGI
jgi:hypothetical protein